MGGTDVALSFYAFTLSVENLDPPPPGGGEGEEELEEEWQLATVDWLTLEQLHGSIVII